MRDPRGIFSRPVSGNEANVGRRCAKRTGHDDDVDRSQARVPRYKRIT